MSEEFVTSPLRKQPKKVLGRGLGSLLGEATAEPPPPKPEVAVTNITNSRVEAAPGTPPVQAPANNSQRIWQIPIEKLFANKEQPRKHFDAEKLTDLTNSIKEKGILLPILARKTADDKYEIIAGERRWRAAQQAGKQEVPVIIRESKSQEALEEAIIENVQRHDLNAMEEAEAYVLLATKYKLTQQEISAKVGKDRATVANLMRLTSLSEDVRKMVKNNELNLGQAKVLLMLADPKEQLKLARKAGQLRLSVRALERMINKDKELEDLDLEANSDSGSRNFRAKTQHLVSELEKIFSTKVTIDGAGETGKINIQFHNFAELNLIIEKMRKIRNERI
jgi:ParB family chromosome partitioning protein